MLFTALLPLLAACQLALDIVANSDGTLTVTLMPRARPDKAIDNKAALKPLSFTATPAELDAEFAKGADGALGQILAQRASFVEQLAAAAAEAARVKKEADAAKAANKASPKPAKSLKPMDADAGSLPAAGEAPSAEPEGELVTADPASLW